MFLVKGNFSTSSPHLSVANPSLSTLNDERRIPLKIDGKVVDLENSKYRHVEANMSDEEDECVDDFNHDWELKLRDYQNELAAPALKGQNTIICCQTGSGKTRVALDIVIKHLQDQGAGKKTNKVCFFARTVPLAIQQYKAICRFLPREYKIKIFTGYSPDNSKMPQLLPNLDVVVVTPMILLNHINWKNVDNMSIFSLLVFDECHHTQEGEPYNSLMFTYMDQKLKGESNLPQIVGLTASIPMENACNLLDAEKSILQLCANLDVSTISVVVKHKEELERTVAIPTEKFVKLQLSDEDGSFRVIVRVMEKLEKEAQSCADDFVRQKIPEKISLIAKKMPENKKHEGYMNWAVDLYNEAAMIPRTIGQSCLPVRTLMVIVEYLQKYHVALQLHDLVHVRDVVKYLDACFAENEKATTKEERVFYKYFKDIQESLKKIQDRDNPNLLLLMNVMEEHLLEKGPLSRGIIFVKTRVVAEALVSWLNRCPNEKIQCLKASVFTGINAKYSEGGMTQVEQNDLLEKFKEGKTRILVATSVGEEGIDVPECNLVVKYDYIGNETTLIQTRGRSRKKGGYSILMALLETKFEKEELNKERTLLMEQGIDKVRKYKKDDFWRTVAKRQREDADKRRLKKTQEDEKKVKQKNKRFKMFCKKCQQFYIESDDIRLLCDNYRVLINRTILDHIEISSATPQTFDDVTFIGSAKCTTVVQKDEKCNGPLGRYILYQKNRYLAMGIRHFMIEEEGQGTLKSYKKWKSVPYPIDEFSMDVNNQNHESDTEMETDEPLNSSDKDLDEDDLDLNELD